MPIPGFQTLMRPLLELHADGGEKTQEELREALAVQFELTPAELEQRLPSGTARTFLNRVAWASTHMTQAGLLVKPRRGISVITDRGRQVLRDQPDAIGVGMLQQFAEYVDFRNRHRQPALQEVEEQHVANGNATPEEMIDDAYEQVRSAVAEGLLTRLVSRDDAFFEEVVLDVLVGLGYGGSKREAAERVGRSGDGGIDGVIREDRLGVDAIYVQAKKWAPQRTVGSREIREFVGALQDVEAAKGVFITTSSFSSDALDLARRRRIVLVDGRQLAELMIDANVGVTTVKTYDLKRVDEDYFADEP